MTDRRLDPDLIEFFETPEEINEALREVMRERRGFSTFSTFSTFEKTFFLSGVLKTNTLVLDFLDFFDFFDF